MRIYRRERKRLEKFRVAYLTENSGLGGGETSLLNLLIKIKQSGNEPILFCPQGWLSSEAAKEGIKIVTFDFPDVHLRGGLFPTFSLSTVVGLIKHLRNFHADLVHAESLLGVYYGGIAAKLIRVPMVATYHGFWPISSVLNKLFLRGFCSRLYPVSKSTESEISATTFGYDGNVHMIHLGVGDPFLENLPSREEARQQLNLPADRSILLHVARFQSIKGQHLILKAVSRLIKEMGAKSPLLVFVGDVEDDAPDEFHSYKAMIHEQAMHPDLKPHIQFVGKRKDVPLFVRAADVSVSPSQYESFGMSTIEAMVVGTPVVATRVGGSSEIIQDGETGILVPPDDPDALANGIRQLIEDTDLAARLALRARSVSLERFGPNQRSNELLKEYRSLLETNTENRYCTKQANKGDVIQK